MKFIVLSSYLLKQLSDINGVITTNPVVPILENFLFEINSGTLTITASDLQTSMITELQVETQEDIKIAIPARILLETLRNLPEQPVTFLIDKETYSIEINSDNGRYKIAGESSNDFPVIPIISDGDAVNIDSNILSRAINATILVTSNDELRPALTGVFMKLADTNTTFVATDTHRLIRYRRVDVVSDIGHSMIIPRKALMLLKGTLPPGMTDTNVNIKFNISNAIFEFDNLKMICRLIDEKFPEYENVIPLDNNNIIVINKNELLNSLKRVAIYANQTTHQISLKITSNEIMISTKDRDFSNEANERIYCEHEGEDLEIGFNAKSLIEIIGNIESDDITLKFGLPSKGGLIIPHDKDEEEDFLMLVMPLDLNNQINY